MSLEPQRCCLVRVLIGLSLTLGALCLTKEAQGQDNLVTVRDAIGMTRLGVPAYMDDDVPGDRVAQFSPDGRRFAVVLKTGDLEHNTNLYTLRIYRTASVFSSPEPEASLTMSSSSNREGIKGVKWLRGSDTIFFIGENPGSMPQIYAFNITKRHLEQVTRHPFPIVAYDVNAEGTVIVFEADPPESERVDNEQTRRDGLVITGQRLVEVLLGSHDMPPEENAEVSRQLFVQTKGGKASQIPVGDGIRLGITLSLCPSGRYALVEGRARQVPTIWSGYKDRLLHEFVTARRQQNAISMVERYLLLDTTTGVSDSLINAPKSWEHDEFVWVSGGQSIVLSNAYLPLDAIDPSQREVREKKKFVAEVRLPSREIVEITDESVKVTKWLEGTSKLILEPRDNTTSIRPKAFEKHGSDWTAATLSPADLAPMNPLEVTYEEGMNTPPKLFVFDRGSLNKSLLLDLNPQFKKLHFAREEAIDWKATDGHQVEGGLYLPPGYSPGKQYPLVIQTHAFDPRKFWIDGPWSSAFAAQPLAAKGIIVLQIGHSKNKQEDREYRSTQMEGARQMASYEGAIDYLEGRGLIDRNRVGIIGFSRTAYHVAYTLTHSKYKFAAATLADGFDGGYFNYVAFSNVAVDDAAVNGGEPFGDTLSLWLKNSPSFNLCKVQPPIRLEAYGRWSALGEWEWFSILSQMEKPVDFILLPEGTHILVKPWERLVSQQQNVDWFTFWLNGEEDSDSSKRGQFERWRRLRDLQTAKQRQRNRPCRITDSEWHGSKSHD